MIAKVLRVNEKETSKYKMSEDKSSGKEQSVRVYRIREGGH